MKNNKTAENPHKNNYFVSILKKTEDGKITYDNIVFTSRSSEECNKFAVNNYTRSVSTAIKKFSDLVNLGVNPKKLTEFKNPVLY